MSDTEVTDYAKQNSTCFLWPTYVSVVVFVPSLYLRRPVINDFQARVLQDVLWLRVLRRALN